MTGRVLIHTPVGVRTGGPEALYQLCDALRSIGVNAQILPTQATASAAEVLEYRTYERVLTVAEPDENDAVVVTESDTLTKWSHFNPELWTWWLSVNNSPIRSAQLYSRREWQPDEGTDDGASFVAQLRDAAFTARTWNKKRLHARRLERSTSASRGHLAQSAYAADFCRTALGGEPSLISDYLGPSPAIGRVTRSANLVAYNGAKGERLVARLRALAPDIDFRAIANMSYHEVCTALSASAAYIELGPLPGRDRMPREAARVGTPVVLLQRGAGQFLDDFPLPAAYLVDCKPGWEAPFLTRLRQVIDDPQTAAIEQEPFAEWVANDRARFSTEVERWSRKNSLRERFPL